MAAPRRVVWSVAFVSGALTLAIEVLWTRFFAVLLAPNVLVIAVLIAGFLAGIPAGSLLVTAVLKRVNALRAPIVASLVASGGITAVVTSCAPFIGRLFFKVHDIVDSGTAAAGLCLLSLFLLVAMPATIF